MAKANGKKTAAGKEAARTSSEKPAASKKKTRAKTTKKKTTKKTATAAGTSTASAATTPAVKTTAAPATRAPVVAQTPPPPPSKKVAVEAEAKDPPKKSRRPFLGGKKNERQPIRCYLCGERFEVSGRTMSTTCTACHKAIKVEDVQVKTYLPVNDLQTCGHIKVTKRGRVAAKRIQSGRGIDCEGSLEGSIETEGKLELGAKSSWKGKELQCRSLTVADGATLNGHVQVPWERD